MNRQVWRRTGRTTVIGALLGSLLLVGIAVPSASAASCLDTGAFDRDGTALTARLVNPGGTVRGPVDATGCSVGIYYDHGRGRVRAADVFGATYYGVLVDGNANSVSVDVEVSAFHDIGDVPMTSKRHGQGVAYRSFNGGSATGTVRGNRVWNFQEAGINLTGPGTTATASLNRVTGRGPQDVISQNRIQVIFGAHGIVVGNSISDLQFTGPNAGNGILLVGGPLYDANKGGPGWVGSMPYVKDARIEANLITATDVGIAVFELDGDWNPPSEATNNLIAHNVIRNGAPTNVGGWDDGVGYQAGILVDGNADRVIGNIILGRGYNQAFCGVAAICLPIDTDVSLDPILEGNLIR